MSTRAERMTTGQSETAPPTAETATSAAGRVDRRSGRLPRRLQAGVRAIDHRLGRLRALLRADEIAFVALAVLVGAGAGFAVTVMSRTTQLLHELLFAIAPGARLSASSGLEAWRVLLVPVAGGLLLGAVMSASGRFRSRQVVDPIEANALYGGRMSLLDSLGVGLETMISNGAGASVGLEAGYTQVGSGGASTLGGRIRLRRNDVRILVGCGAAGAIAAAFDGAADRRLLRVRAGDRRLRGGRAGAGRGERSGRRRRRQAAGRPDDLARDRQHHDAHLAGPAPAPAGRRARGPGRDRADDRGDQRRARHPRHPAAPRHPPGARRRRGRRAGTLSHQVLASGHGALASLLVGPLPLREIALVLACKALASAISIGSGFRGGLFFASLFMGALTGALIAGGINALVPWLYADPQAYALIGMSSMAVAVVGGPLTMVFMALEMTGDFALAPSLIAAS